MTPQQFKQIRHDAGLSLRRYWSDYKKGELKKLEDVVK